MKLKIKKLRPNTPTPTRSHESDTGLDLYAVEIEKVTEDVYMFKTGIAVEPSQGYYCEVVPRSGIYKTRWIQANGIGVIDAGYRGEIMVPMRFSYPVIIGNDNVKWVSSEESTQRARPLWQSPIHRMVDGPDGTFAQDIKENEIENITGTRFAQLVLRKLELCQVELVGELSQSARGTSGFGSTGTGTKRVKSNYCNED